MGDTLDDFGLFDVLQARYSMWFSGGGRRHAGDATVAQFLSTLLKHLGEPDDEWPPADRPLAAKTVVLATMVAKQAAGWPDLGTGTCPSLPRLIAHATIDLSLLEVLALTQGCSLVDLAERPNLFEGMTREMDGFRTAVGAGRIRTLLRDRQELSAQVTVFHNRLTWSAEEVETHVRETLSGVLGDRIDAFLCEFGLERLRACPDAQLAERAESFVQWSPLVRYLSDRAKGVEFQDSTIESRLGQLLDDLRKRLSRLWTSHDRTFDVADATSQAVLTTMDRLCSAKSGYAYEGSLEQWLVSVALSALRNEFRRYARRHRKLEEEMTENLTDASEGEESARLSEEILRWRERYLVVETFFHDPVRAKAVWRHMIEAALPTVGKDGPLSDDPPRQVESEDFDEDNTTRRRLRQRLRVLEYILDDVPKGAADEPGDVSVLASVEAHYGKDPTALPTLRALANLARAAQSERTLAWAYLARRLTISGMNHSDAHACFERFLKPSTGLPNPQECDAIRDKLARALTWHGGHAGSLKKLRKHLKDERLLFLLSPCWHLAVLRNMDVVGAQKVLNQTDKENPAIEYAYSVMLRPNSTAQSGA